MQHCPTCGAENEEEAQFCAECGTPLDAEAESIPVDDEPTLLSTNISELIEAQKTEIFESDAEENNDDDDGETIQVNLDEVTDAVFEESSESTPPPTEGESSGGAGANDSSEGWMTQRNIIIAIVVLLVLCCCFFAIVGGGLVAFGEEFANVGGLSNLLMV